MSTIINSAASLYALMNTTSLADLGKSYIQTTNIDMTGYTSDSIAHDVGLTPYVFSGVYDGGGYTITIGNVVSTYTGLFDSVTTPGIIKNVNVIYTNTITNSPTRVWGGLVGEMTVSTIMNCTVKINGVINVSSSAAGLSLGLLCGFMGQNSLITDSRLTINNSITLIGGNDSEIGLLCGLATDSGITNCSILGTNSTYDITLKANENTDSDVGLICGYCGTSITTLNVPLMRNITVNLNNNGQIILTSVNTGTINNGAMCGTLDGDSIGGTTEADNCIVNITNNQTLVGNFNDFFGQVIDNITIQNCQFNYTTTTANTSKITLTTPRPSPALPVLYTNNYSNLYTLTSGSYYIPTTNATLIIGSQTIGLQSQSPTGILINGILQLINTTYSSSNSEYVYTIYVKGVGSMYFGLDLIAIENNTINNSIECVCQIDSCSTNPQTGITQNSRITNIKEDKTIRVNVDREFMINSIIAPKFKSYRDYMKYLQGGLKY